MKKLKQIVFPLALPLAALLLASCFGIETELVIGKNGAGTIDMTYTLSSELAGLGDAAGNGRWLPVPVGREDFERTVSRIPGLRLASFSRKEEGGDCTCRVKLAFGNLDALMAFLGDTGGNAALNTKGGVSSLRLALVDGFPQDNKNFLDFIRSQSEGRTFTLRVKSSLGNQTFEYQIPMGELLSSPDPVLLEIPL
jgi:hypothetical protein